MLVNFGVERVIQKFRGLGYTFELTSTVPSAEYAYSGKFVNIEKDQPDIKARLRECIWQEVAHGDTFEEVVMEAAKKAIANLTIGEILSLLFNS